MARATIFEFKDYRAYLDQELERRQKEEKGQRSKLATVIGCHPAYLTRILSGEKDMSLEQAQSTNDFFGHTPVESKYFLNMVSFARAGTPALRKYFEGELNSFKEESLALKKRAQFNRILTHEDQAIYYSAWYFTAIHVGVSIHGLKNKEALSQALHLPLATVSEVLEFLLRIGLLQKHGAEYQKGEASLFLAPDSPFMNKHHLNWLNRAVRSLDERKPGDYHYSSVASCSKEDFLKIRELLLNATNEARKLITESKRDEVLFSWNIHLFNLLENP